MKLFDRIYGCLSALALGDALGMSTEFMTPEEIRASLGWVDHPVAAPDWHPHRIMQAGQVTDDTGQALATAHAFTPDGQLTAQAEAAELLRWAKANAAILEGVLGPSTRQALKNLRLGADPRQSGRSGKTNGAAFRAVGVALANLSSQTALMEQVVEACLPTHGTSVAISGAAAVAFAIAAAAQEGATLEGILAAARRGAVEGRQFGAYVWGTPLDKRIELARDLVRQNPEVHPALAALYNYVGTDLLVAESMAAAFGVVALADGDPMKAVVYGANIGGDTDTIAAIAGAVCGAWRGIDAIDGSLLSFVESVNSLDLAAEARRLEAINDRRGQAHG